MSEILSEIIDIFEKNNLTLKDYKRFRELGRKVDGADIVEYSSINEGMKLRLPEIAEKEGNYNWLEPEDED
tara:strand:- start:22063 stop:22275 length:213 start_codon:yes stop_codon:yes gene_type:complete